MHPGLLHRGAGLFPGRAPGKAWTTMAKEKHSAAEISEKAITSEAADAAAEESAAQARTDHPRRSPFLKNITEEKSRNIVLALSLAQLVLAVLMYMLPSIRMSILLVETAIAVALGLFVRFGPQESRVFRGILRVVFILLFAVPLVFSIAAAIWTNSLRSLDSNEATQAMLTLSNWFLLADVALPPLLFLQPVLALNTRGSRPFDRVLLRILSILALAGTILLCFFALEYTTPDGSEILTQTTYFPVLFGHTFTIPIAFENVITRILLCVLGAGATVFSFLPARHSRKDLPSPHSAKEEAVPEKKTRGRKATQKVR